MLKGGKSMRKYSRKALALVLSLVMTAGMVMTEGTAFAAGNDKADNSGAMIKEIARQFADSGKDPFAFRGSTGKGLKLNADISMPQFDLSAKFMKDGDETSYVTPVKFQNPFGSCWGFAAIAAAETSIIGDGIAPGYAAEADPENGVKELDLSEKHLINFLVTPINDPDSSQNGEGMQYVKDNVKLTDRFNLGGLSIYATGLFASGMGPDREDRTVAEGLPEDIFVYKGLAGDIEQRKTDDGYEDYCYSDGDDWSMPESLRFNQSYTLDESYLLPSPAKRVQDEDHPGDDPVYEYDPLGTEAIKTELVNKRAVEIAFCADTSMPGQEEKTQYISDNWAHYTFIPDQANHAVTIVGWDDNYSKENFRHLAVFEDEEGNQSVKEAPLPPEDGAWLVKNSWGSGEREFPNKGPATWGIVDEETGKHTGYFWLSYYDQSLDSPEALKFIKEVPGEGYYLDQYDYMPVNDIQTADLPDKVSMSNVFQAEGNQKLDYISCQTAAPGTTVEYEVYILRPGYENPQDGVKLASGTSKEPFQYGGFHKIPVEDDVIIQKGQYYSIIVTQKTPENKYNINIQTGTLKEMAELFGDPCWQKGIVNPGESFVNLNGKWYDYSDDDFRKKVFDNMHYFFSLDNFPIKGYCSKVQDLKMYLPGGNVIELPRYREVFFEYEDVSENITVGFRRGTGAKMPAHPQIDWKIAEGSEDIFEMIPDEKNPAAVTVKARKPGVGYLSVSAKGMIDKADGAPGEQEEISIGTQVVRINVPKRGWYNVWDIGEIFYGDKTGLWINNVDGSDVPKGTFTYKSDNKKIATVSAKGIVKAVGIGKTIIRVSDPNGAEEQVHVKVIKAEQKAKIKGRTLAVKAATLKKKNMTVKPAKVIKVSNAVGKVTYSRKSGSKKIVVRKNGKVTIKKGLKKGTYKVKVNVKAAGSKNYKKFSKAVTFTVKVK